MRIYRSSELPNSTSRSEMDNEPILDFFLDIPDIRGLIDSDTRQIVNRFGECNKDGGVTGWSPQDKVWVALKELHDNVNKKLVDLHLDKAGDLYFTIQMGEELQNAQGVKVFDDLNELVSSDPNDHLRKIGIETIRIFNLEFLSCAVYP